MCPYASETTVPVGRSIERIKDLLRSMGAKEIVEREAAGGHALGFLIVDPSLHSEKPVPVQLRADKPKMEDCKVTPAGRERKPADAEAHAVKEYARRWRVLELLVRAKMVAIQEGGTTLWREFVCDVVMPDGTSLGLRLQEAVGPALESGKLRLPALGDGGRR